MKIGVLADSHVPDRQRTLPPGVLEIFSSVEIVLHAGDITRMDLLQQLQEQVSLTFAVYGDRDPAAVRTFLQEIQVLEFGGVRIGLIHGNRDSRTEFRDRLRGLFRPWAYTPALFDYLLSRFTNVDAIVFGHTHLPYARIHNGVFFFNPGSLVPRSGEPSVGVLEIDTRGIRGRILNLRTGNH
jgi:putative phosphoesterase